MEGEQFSLCWNNFHTNLSTGFQSLFKDEDLVDCTLAADGKFLKAHKTVLSVCSPFFKDLFRVNPCKHPIVILPDVNYQALCNLLHFMYQGEVSVSQDEIPSFMRVAEMLKVKGLTDNNSPTKEPTNGFPKEKDIKRPTTVNRPTKQKTTATKPMQPAKRAHLDEEALIKPKQEPIDHDEQINDEMASNEPIPSPSHQFPKWPTPKNEQQDCSTPGTIQCVLGRRGNPRLIVDGYPFFKKSVYKGKAFWYCKCNKSEKCQATCWTLNGTIVKWPEEHTHSPMPDVFNPDEDTEVPIENLQEVLWQTSL